MIMAIAHQRMNMLIDPIRGILEESARHRPEGERKQMVEMMLESFSSDVRREFDIIRYQRPPVTQESEEKALWVTAVKSTLKAWTSHHGLRNPEHKGVVMYNYHDLPQQEPVLLSDALDKGYLLEDVGEE